MIKKALINGLQIFLPLAITFSLLIWLLYAIESLFSAVILTFLPAEFYFPGLGTIIGLAILFIVSLLLNAWVFQRLSFAIESWLEKTPAIKIFYLSIKEFVGVFFASRKERKGQPVVVQISDDFEILGMISNESPENLEPSLDGKIAVYLPLSYQIGGYTVMVTKEKVRKLSMNPQEALGIMLSAGLLKKQSQRKSRTPVE